MASSNPLGDYLKAARPTEYEMKKILREAAKEAERAILELSKGGKDKIRIAQISLVLREIRRIQETMWGQIHGTIRTGVGRVSQMAFVEAEDLLIEYMKEQGEDLTFVRQMLAEISRRGLEGIFAKAANGIPLSSQVYYTQALSQGIVEKVVRSGILLQKSAREISKDVKHLIRPDTPGGVSNAAFRLARTELNNAFKTAQEKRYEDEPWVLGMEWNLSGSHPRRDVCNDNADNDEYGLGAGVYPVGKRPDSHPNCLCYLTVVQVSEEDFIEGFLAGDYDDYLDGKFGGGFAFGLRE